MRRWISSLTLLLGAWGFPGAGLALDDDFLSGSWDGRRDRLEEKGMSFELVLTTELVANLHGGISQDRGLLGNVDLTLEVDTEKAGLWSGGTFFAYVLGNFQSRNAPSALVGDIQATSNIEAPEALKLYEFWYLHTFLDDRASLLFGLHDYNSEFEVLEVAQLFRHSSFGISPDISQVGPSIFPTTALGTRFSWRPSDSLYLLAAVYDGVPGDPDDENGTHIQLRSEDGLFYAAEVGFALGDPAASPYSKVALGGWLTSRDFEDFQGALRDRNAGVYAIAETTLWREADAGQGLSGFLQLGFAHRNRNQISHYVGGGLTYTGLIPGREGDVLGLAVGSARYSSQFVRAEPEARGGETAIELSYQAAVLPWLVLQPDVQYIIAPGSEPGLPDALQVGLTWQVSF